VVDPWDLLLAEETGRAAARESGRATAAPAPRPVAPPHQKQTYIYDKLNVIPPLGWEILNVKGRAGTLEEAVFKCSASNFGIYLHIDNTAEINRTWSDFASISDDVDNITAIHRNGEYVLSLSDYHFRDEIILRLSGKRLTFSRIYVKVTYG